MEKFNLSIPVTVCPTSVFSAEDNSNKVSARARVRIFYKGLNQKTWFELADAVMYKSKEGGRDTVSFADE